MWFPIRIILLSIIIAASATMMLSGVRVWQIGGVVLLILLVFFLLGTDWYLAWTNERHVTRRPDLLKNDMIGEAARALGCFHAANGMSIGVVSLRGEHWRACCSGAHIPADGEALIVRERDGLTLYVHPAAGEIKPS